MSLIGESVSHYRILKQLGSGGMGVIYEAEDTRLGREVALKFLPEQLWNDPNARERLQREARSASALNHPNICTIYDIGEDSGRHFIVMERLHGQPFSQLILGRQVAIDTAIELAIQICDALETAHARGIVHRDIKPANLFLTDRGESKVLDFGLAKRTLSRTALSVGMAATETHGENLTSPGSAVGTIAYMSPEQARGEDVDARSDLFSLGGVLYELTTGALPFAGATSAVLFDSILNRPPVPPTRLNPEVSPELERIILKCLEKDRDLRYQSAGDLKADLKRLRRDTHVSSLKVAAAPVSAHRSHRLWWVIAAMMVAIAFATALWRWSNAAPTPAPQSEWIALTDFSDSVVYPALSPDGRMLAFVRGDDVFLPTGEIYIKLLPNGEPVQLTHDRLTKMAPTFSYDGASIGYTVIQGGWQIYTVPVLGGESKLYLPNAENLHWISATQLMFSEVKEGIHMGLVTAGEGRTSQRDIYLPPTDRGMAHLSALSPDGKQVLITEMGASGNFLPCRVVPFDGSSPGMQVGPQGSACLGVAWSPDGQWMYLNADTADGFHIWRQRYPRGTPQQITFGPSEQHGIAVAPDGSLLTSVGGGRISVWLRHPPDPDREISPQGNTFDPKFSQDGKWIYCLRYKRSPEESHAALIRVDLSTFQIDTLFSELSIRKYDLSPDDKHVALDVEGANGKTQIWIAPLDRRSAPRRLDVPETLDEPLFVSDSELLVRFLDQGKHYIERMRLDGSGRTRILATPVAELDSVSPDHRWFVVPEADSTDPSLLTIAAHALDGGRKVPICHSCLATWSPDRKVLFLDFGLSGDTLVTLPILPSTGLPALPLKALDSPKDAMKIPGAKFSESGTRQLRGIRRTGGLVMPSPAGNRAAVTRQVVQRNIFRIPMK